MNDQFDPGRCHHAKLGKGRLVFVSRNRLFPAVNGLLSLRQLSNMRAASFVRSAGVTYRVEIDEAEGPPLEEGARHGARFHAEKTAFVVDPFQMREDHLQALFSWAQRVSDIGKVSGWSCRIRLSVRKGIDLLETVLKPGLRLCL